MENPQIPPLRRASSNQGLLGKLAMTAITLILVVAGLMFSLLVFAVAAVVCIVLWFWLWWKTRSLERVLTERFAQMKRDGIIPDTPPVADAVTIEGEATRIDPDGK